MRKIDSYHHQIIKAFKENSYNAKDKTEEILELSNLNLEINLKEVPILTILNAKPEQLIKNFYSLFKGKGYFSSNVSDPDINQIDEAFKLVKKGKSSELLYNKEDKLFYSMNFIVKPLKNHQRIEYSFGDKEYLEALWQSSHKGDEDAKKLLEKELAEVPKFGFILNINLNNILLEKFFAVIFYCSFISYLFSECSGTVALSLFVNTTRLKWVDVPNGDYTPIKKKSAICNPNFKFSKNFYNIKKLVKGKELPFSSLLEMTTSRDVELIKYKHV